GRPATCGPPPSRPSRPSATGAASVSTGRSSSWPRSPSAPPRTSPSPRAQRCGSRSRPPSSTSTPPDGAPMSPRRPGRPTSQSSEEITMPTVVVRYRTKPERADENQQLVEKVFAELHEMNATGFGYASFRLEDGVSFVHVVVEEEGGGSVSLGD